LGVIEGSVGCWPGLASWAGWASWVPLALLRASGAVC